MSLGTVTRNITIGVTVLGIVSAGIMAGQIFEDLKSGNYHIKQEYISGDMSVINDPGVYLQMFADIHEYPVSDTYDFTSTPIEVRFNDAATAKVSGQIKYRLPSIPNIQLELHEESKGYTGVRDQLVKEVVNASLRQSATHFGAEDIYSTRRGDFIELVRKQIQDGIYSTEFKESRIHTEEGDTRIIRRVYVKYDDSGQPIISEPSVFESYKMGIIQLTIQDIDFDDRTDELIAARKESEQQEIVSKADAKRAKQDAIKAREEGKAKVALVEAEALAVKKTAVIEAEKEREVAEEQALKALEDEKRIKAIGRAEAEAARLKVAAGLSPLEAAQIEKETKIGIAKELAKINYPRIFVNGGSGGNSVDPLEALGLKAMIEINDKMNNQ